MARWVLLRHTLPDGSAHLDWMIERSPNGPLRTFRLPDGLQFPAAPFLAHPLDDHRNEYLEYQGPISGDRGIVSRLIGGTCQLVEEPGQIRVNTENGDAWTGKPEGASWRFELAPREGPWHTG